MSKKKKRNLKLNKIQMIVFGVIFMLLLVSIIFTNKLTYLFSFRPNLESVKGLEVHFLDVGQGDAILVRLPNNKTLLIDSGTKQSKSKIISYIDNVFFYKQEAVFDYAILTHSDSDHSGNFEFILENYRVENIYRPMIYSSTYDAGKYTEDDVVIVSEIYDGVIQTINELENEGVPVHYNFKGAEKDDIKNYITFLTPTVNSYKGSESEINNYSPMILLSYQSSSILLTGDASTLVEEELMSSIEDMDIDVLKIGHHGSSTSTSLEFLQFLKPEYAVISYGTNSYGHPSDIVMSNIEDYNENLYHNIFTTYESGNVICYISESVNFTNIQNVNDYIYIDWWYFGIGGMGACLIVVFFPKYHKVKK